MNTTFLVFGVVMAAGGVWLLVRFLAKGLRWIGGLVACATGSIDYGGYGGHDIPYLVMNKLQPILGSRELRKLFATLIRNFL